MTNKPPTLYLPLTSTDKQNFSFCLVCHFPFVLLILQNLPRGCSQGHSPRPSLGPRVRALSWLPEHVLADYLFSDQGTQSPRGSMCLVHLSHTQHITQHSTPQQSILTNQPALQWGFRERATWNNFCPMRGSHFSGRG